MADSKTAQEPSMEEILSSIRRIIAEDEADGGLRGAAGGGPAADTAADSDDDVLELTEVVGGPTAPPASPPLVAQTTTAPPPPAIAPTPTAPESPPMHASAADMLVSPVAANASAQALARLTRAVSTDERKTPIDSGATIEQFLVDLLTPMLRDWLDKNLPEIVERVVEQEVKKLARRAELM